jgi:hypothetical protein
VQSTPLSSESLTVADRQINNQSSEPIVRRSHYCPKLSPGSPMIVSPVPTPLAQRSKNIPEPDAHNNRIADVVDKSNNDRELIGDFSKCHALPLIPGKHNDLKCISPETLAKLINGEYKNILPDFKVIDCRYPYEYDGGHIVGAENIYTPEQLAHRFFNENQGQNSTTETNRTAIIFHCEFSSKRAPKM